MYEYLIITESEQLHQHLADKGKEGWELIATYTPKMPMTGTSSFILKRRIRRGFFKTLFHG